jgi:peptidyl-prolyl cis-trans isomerase A (cyclophilin A)
MKMNLLWIPAALALMVAGVVGCGSGDKQAADTKQAAPAAQKAEQPAAGQGEPPAGDSKAPQAGQTKDAVAEGQAQMAENALLDWRSLNETAPDVFKAKFETSKGDFVIEVHRDWAPRGADRFYNLVKAGFFDECRFFRVLHGFMAQIGINGDPKVSSVWQQARFPDDPVKKSNTRGMVSFATAGPNTRTTQFFINFGDNSGSLDPQGFSPFGMVDEAGMKIVDSLYGDYGEGAPRGQGPNQAFVQAQGNAYLQKMFPNLDYVKKATIVK